jgi:hypothetical protein
VKKKSGSVGSGGVQTDIFYHIGQCWMWCEVAGVQFQLPALQAKVTLTPKKAEKSKVFYQNEEILRNREF